MISRRNIRIKVMQSIYATLSQVESMENKSLFLDLAQKQYHDLLKNFEQTILHFVFFWAGFFDYLHARKEILNRRRGLDIRLFDKYYESDFFQRLFNSAIVFTAKKQLNKTIDHESMETMYRKFFDLIVAQCEAYTTYATTDSLIKEEELLRTLWETHLEDSPLWKSFTDEYIPHSENDEGMLVSLLEDLFIAPADDCSSPTLVREQKKQFGLELLRATIDKWEHTGQLINEKVEHWDESRINQIDGIILRMGATEVLYFDEIPNKVSINEYIDIGKMYSSMKAGLFINGILDVINKEQGK